MKVRLLAVAMAVALASCASGNKNTSTTQVPKRQPETAQAPAPETGQQPSGLEGRVTQQASGNQAGKVVAVEDDFLVLDPYEASAGEARIALEPKTPVFEAGKDANLDPKSALQPGSDVIVYFDERSGQAPLVLGIKKLDQAEAQQLQQAQGSGTPAQSPEELFAGASGQQEGKIQEATQDELKLDPYEADAGVATLKIDDSTKVVQNGVEVGRSALTEGADVRVHFDTSGGGAPKAIGVELLPPDEAKKIQEQQQ